MSAFVDSLNLRPQEKRVIVVIGVVIFVVLNFWFVFPEFKEKARIEFQLRTTRKSIADYKSIIAMDNNPNSVYKKQLKKLQQQEGSTGSQFGGDIQLLKTVYDQARANGVNIGSSDPVNTSHLGTNASTQFFEEQSMSITANAKEENLIKFLYNVGNDPAMIRVKELSLHPADANRYELNCRIVFTADYKKSAATKPVQAKVEAPLVPTAKLPVTPTQRPAAPTGNPAKPAPAGSGIKFGSQTNNPARRGGPPPFPAIPGGRRAITPQTGPQPPPPGRTQ